MLDLSQRYPKPKSRKTKMTKLNIAIENNVTSHHGLSLGTGEIGRVDAGTVAGTCRHFGMSLMKTIQMRLGCIDTKLALCARMRTTSSTKKRAA